MGVASATQQGTIRVAAFACGCLAPALVSDLLNEHLPFPAYSIGALGVRFVESIEAGLIDNATTAQLADQALDDGAEMVTMVTCEWCQEFPRYFTGGRRAITRAFLERERKVHLCSAFELFRERARRRGCEFQFRAFIVRTGGATTEINLDAESGTAAMPDRHAHQPDVRLALADRRRGDSGPRAHRPRHDRRRRRSAIRT